MSRKLPPSHCAECGVEKNDRRGKVCVSCALRARDHSNRIEPAKRAATKSRYLGVYFTSLKREKPWRAYLWFNRKLVYNAYFESETAAALARDGAARSFYEDRARLNFPRAGERGIN